MMSMCALFFAALSTSFITIAVLKNVDPLSSVYNKTLIASCSGEYLLDTDKHGANGNDMISCGLNKRGDLLFRAFIVNSNDLGSFLCETDDGAILASIDITETKVNGKDETNNTGKNTYWLSSDRTCGEGIDLADKNDQTWSKSDLVLCSRKNVIRQCQAALLNSKQSSDDDDFQRYLAPLITILMALFIAAVVVVGFIFLRRKHSEIDDLMKLHDELVQPIDSDALLNPEKPLREQVDQIPFDRNYEIRLHRIAIRKVVSKGRYGRVYIAELKPRNMREESMEVNVKGPKEAAKYDDIRALADEAKMMMAIGMHPNVLCLIGVVIDNMSRGGDLYLVVEHTQFNLKSFLYKRKDYFIDEVTEKDSANNSEANKTQRTNPKKEKTLGPSITTSLLCSFAYQIANGMEYLAKKHCVHRDLAARNVLLRTNRIVRIADFGEDRQWDYQYLVQSIEYSSPFKIMARESISEARFSEKTDVWSYGILLWEIFTLGEDPHKNFHSPQKLAEFYQQGGRLNKPTYMPENVSKLMFECWHENPGMRPGFINLRNLTQNILKERNSELYCWLQNQLHEELMMMNKYMEWRDGPNIDSKKRSDKAIAEV